MKKKGTLEERYEVYEADYLADSPEDDDTMRALRERIRDLPLPERRIFIMYTEFGTYSEVAKVLKCSVPTVSKKIREIREKILK